MDLDLVPGRSPISVAGNIYFDFTIFLWIFFLQYFDFTIFFSAAAIYMAVQASVDKKTQREISDIAGVAEVTIKQSYKLMIPRAAELFPENFKFDTPIDQLPAS